MAQLDLAYHDVHRGRGLYYLLQRSGAVDRVVRDLDIFEAKSVPPHGHPAAAVIELPWVLAMHTDDPLATQDSISPGDLVAIRYIAYP